MRKLTVILIVLGSLLLAPASAQSHPGRWYWSIERAERVMSRVDSVHWVPGCWGTGSMKRGRSGEHLYKHFTCHVWWEDGVFSQVDVHVTGRAKAVYREYH